MIGSSEYQVASQIPLPKRRSKRWRHITKVPPSEWQATLLGSTVCWRRYVAIWEVSENKLLLRFVMGCYQLLNPEFPLWAEWVTGDFRVVSGNCVEYVHAGYESSFEHEFVLPVVGGIIELNQP